RTMPYTVSKIDVWTRAIDDTPGSLATVLEPLADAGVDLQFLIARRRTLVPRQGVVFLGGISGAKGAKAAAAAGLTKATDITGLRVEGPNKAGDCHRVTRLLANAGINLRGLPPRDRPPAYPGDHPPRRDRQRHRPEIRLDPGLRHRR